MSFDPREINLTRELTYSHPFANSTLFIPLLFTLLQQQRSPRTKNTFKDQYDYVIVGGGTAGSVLANRLSEEECATVLLLEYGDHPPIMSDFTPLYSVGWKKDIDYNYKTVPQKHTGFALKDNRIVFPRGKVLGGSSVINAMLYVRGNHRNFDDWSAMGADGWSYDEVLPYFMKSEDNNNPDYVESGFHGVGGPLSISDQVYIEEFQAPILEAAKQYGYRVGDSNGAIQTGFYPEQGTTRNTQRCSAAKAFLVPAENRTNLDILVNAHVNKVIFDEVDGELTATGVEFDSEGNTHTVTAKREVIMSAGTINTPQILLLSGVGPKEELEKHGIPVLKDLPVGRSLYDHAASSLDYVMKPGIPTATEKLTDEANMRQYISNRTGPLASLGLIPTLAFLKGNETEPEEDFPNFGIYMIQSDATAFRTHYEITDKIYDSYYKQYEGKPFLKCLVSQLQPKSTGSVTLNSTDSYDDPVIDTNYFEDPEDVESIVQGLQVCEKIMQSDLVVDALGAESLSKFPGCESYEDDEYFKCYLKQFSTTIFHPTSTAKMGNIQNNDTVVSPELKVKGIKNLRVVDASIMPMVTSGNTVSVVYMIAEKAADMIKEDMYMNMQQGTYAC